MSPKMARTIADTTAKQASEKKPAQLARAK